MRTLKPWEAPGGFSILAAHLSSTISGRIVAPGSNEVIGESRPRRTSRLSPGSPKSHSHPFRRIEMRGLA